MVLEHLVFKLIYNLLYQYVLIMSIKHSNIVGIIIWVRKTSIYIIQSIQLLLAYHKFNHLDKSQIQSFK